MKPVRTRGRTPGERIQRILLVEDEPALAEILQALLRARGRFEVLLARDAEDALAQARQSPPDVAVLDLEVRDLDVAGLLQKLRQDHEALPALACGGAAAREPAGGFDALFLKPLDLRALLAQVERILGERGRK